MASGSSSPQSPFSRPQGTTSRTSSGAPSPVSPGTPYQSSPSASSPASPGSPSRKPSYVDVEGVLEPWACDVGHVLFAIMYRPYPGDVFVASYPRCGGAWIAYLLFMLTNDGQEPSSQIQLMHEIPFMEYVGRKVEDLAPPRKLKTHLPASRMRLSPAAKYIYVVRNYKDCCVSLYEFMTARAADYRFCGGTFEDYFESFLAGTVEDNDYFDHLNSWWSRRDQPNFFFLSVENLKQNFQRQIVEMAEFLEGPAACLVRDPEKLQRLVSRGVFDCTLRDESFGVPYLRDGDCFISCVRCVSGYWRGRLTEEQVRRLDDKFCQRTKGSPLEQLFVALGYTV